MKDITKITKDFLIIEKLVRKLLDDRYVFEIMRNFVVINKLDDSPVHKEFLRYIAFTYRDLALINVCKQCDEDSRSLSLINWLKCIKSFKNIHSFKPKSALIKANIEEDIKQLRKAIKGRRTIPKRALPYTKNSLWGFRNKRGAHYSKHPFKSEANWRQLYSAIDLMDSLILKYQLFLTGSQDYETILTSNLEDYYIFDQIFKQNETI